LFKAVIVNYAERLANSSVQLLSELYVNSKTNLLLTYDPKGVEHYKTFLTFKNYPMNNWILETNFDKNNLMFLELNMLNTTITLAVVTLAFT
jgi:hypothetical protein